MGGGYERPTMEPREPLAGVGKTALGVAYVREMESSRPDRLFEDPYARAFLAAAPGAFREERVPSGGLASLGAAFALHAVIRTRFFDDYLLAASAAGCRQVVLLAAGLDTRAFRMGWPEGMRLFELDLPGVLDFKEAVLAGQDAAPRCERIALPADLRENWSARLTDAGLEPTRPTAWLAEGLLIYLSADQAANLLNAVGELSAAGSRISFEHGNIADASLLSEAHAMPRMDQYTSLWEGGLGEDAPDWLARHGWQVKTHDFDAVVASFGRPVPEDSGGGFLTAIRSPNQ